MRFVKRVAFLMIFAVIFTSVGCQKANHCVNFEHRLCQAGWQAACTGMGRWMDANHSSAEGFCDYMNGLLNSGNRRNW